MITKEQAQQLAAKLQEVTMTDREKYILSVRFGFVDNTLRTLEETGKIAGVSRERVRQIENKFLKAIGGMPKVG